MPSVALAFTQNMRLKQRELITLQASASLDPQTQELRQNTGQSQA